MYVGDNPAKDFFAPVQLGMLPIWFENEEGLYSNDDSFVTEIRKIPHVREITQYFTNTNMFEILIDGHGNR